MEEHSITELKEENSLKDFKKELRRDSGINALLLIAFWVVYYAVALSMPRIASLFVKDMESALYQNAATLIFYVLLYPVGFSLILLLFRILKKNNREAGILSCFRKPQMPAGWTFKWIILTIGATYSAAMISNLIFLLIETITGVNLTEAEMTTDTSALGIMTTLISAPLFAPFFEELFFRGTLYRNVRKYGTWSMIITGGLTFGLWHANYPQFLFAMSMGIFSCFLFEKTKSVIPSMIVHFVVNSIGTVMSILLGQLEIGGKDELAVADMMALFKEHPVVIALMMMASLGIMAFLVLWLVLLIVEITCHRESFVIEKPHPEISEGKKFLIYMTSPAMAAIMTAMLVLTVWRALGGSF